MKRKPRPPPGGFVLIMVLVVVLLASMVVISLLFVLGAEHTAAAASSSSEQARAAAMSGICQAMDVAAGAAPGSLDWQDNPAVFRDQLVCDDGVQRWCFSVCSFSDAGGIRYGLTDEASKINVYHATQAMLGGLPNLTPALAQSLLSAAAAGGPAVLADTDQPDATPSPPPAPMANPSWTCLDELLQVSGFTTPLLYGGYSNLAVRADTLGDSSLAAVLTDAQDNQANVGVRQFLTVSSYDLNQDGDGRARLNLNQPGTDLSAVGLPKGALDYLDALRRNGQSLGHPVELLEASGQFTNEHGLAVALSSGIGKAELPVLLDRCTATNLTRLPGLVNLNTASTTVLAALPGLNAALAEAIVAARAGLSPEALKTPAWLYREGILNADAFKQVAPYLTTRSYQFRFLVAAYTVPVGGYCVLEVVVDAASKPPAVLFLRDVSRLGLPFNPATPAEDGGQTTVAGRPPGAEASLSWIFRSAAWPQTVAWASCPRPRGQDARATNLTCLQHVSQFKDSSAAGPQPDLFSRKEDFDGEWYKLIGWRQPVLINTPLQRGAARRRDLRNRFNGFSHRAKTVETVSAPFGTASTPLKRGVNETRPDQGLRRCTTLCQLLLFLKDVLVPHFPVCAFGLVAALPRCEISSLVSLASRGDTRGRNVDFSLRNLAASLRMRRGAKAITPARRRGKSL